MPYPHQPGSPFFDGADAFEAYLEDQEQFALIQCAACNGEGYSRKCVSVYEHGCGFPHDDVEEIKCKVCDGAGTVAVNRADNAHG